MLMPAQTAVSAQFEDGLRVYIGEENLARLFNMSGNGLGRNGFKGV